MHQFKAHRSSRVARLVRLTPLCALALGLGVGVQAQTTSSATSASGGGSAASSQQARQQGQQTSLSALRVSEMIDMDVRDTQGKEIGEVRDLIVNAANGNARYAVLEFDPGFLAGERLVPVPLARLKLGEDRNALVFDGNRAQLEQVGVVKDDWNDQFLRDPKRLAQIDQRWGLKRQGSGANLWRASTLVGKNVDSRQGQAAGEIEDLVVQLDRQRVHYAVLDVNADWGGQDKRIAVPLSAFSRGADNEEVMVNLDRAKVQAVQGLNREAFQNPNDPNFSSQIDRQLAALASPTDTRALGAGAAETPPTPRR